MSPSPSLGSRLIRFFEDEPRTLGEFLGENNDLPPGNVVRGLRRLCEAGAMTEIPTWSAHDGNVLDGRFQTIPRGQHDLRHLNGEFDFIVSGMPAVFERRYESVFLLDRSDPGGLAKYGSAFYIGRRLFLTAAHCVEGADANSISLHSTHDDLIEVHELRIEPDRDLAFLLASQAPQVTPIPIRSPVILEPAMVIGYPQIPALIPTVVASVGEVAGRGTAFIDRNEYWLTTCRMTGGSSGGPVLGQDGAAIGVVSALPAAADQTSQGSSVQGVDRAPWGLFVDANGAGELSWPPARS